MEELNSISLLDKNYNKVLDLISIRIDNRGKALELFKKVNNLTWKANKKELGEIIDNFNIYWNAIPKEAFDIDSIEKLNLRINQFSKYILSIESSFKDHGFSLLVTYYLKVVMEFLDN